MNYLRNSLTVGAIKYEQDKGLEDGFELLSKVVVNGWVTTDILVKIEDSVGTIRCPFIKNKRGRIFIGEGDYIITETDGERHVCGGEKFEKRFKKIE